MLKTLPAFALKTLWRTGILAIVCVIAPSAMKAHTPEEIVQHFTNRAQYYLNLHEYENYPANDKLANKHHRLALALDTLDHAIRMYESAWYCSTAYRLKHYDMQHNGVAFTNNELDFIANGLTNLYYNLPRAVFNSVPAQP